MKALAVRWVESIFQMALAVAAIVIIGMVVIRDADAREVDRLRAAENVEGNAWPGSPIVGDHPSPAHERA